MRLSSLFATLFLTSLGSACAGEVCGECSESMVASMRTLRAAQPEDKATRPADAWVMRDKTRRTDGLGGEVFVFEHTRHGDAVMLVARIEPESTRDAFVKREVTRIESGGRAQGAALVSRNKSEVVITWREPAFVGPKAVNAKAPTLEFMIYALFPEKGQEVVTACEGYWPEDASYGNDDDLKATCARYDGLFSHDPEEDGSRLPKR